MIKIQSMKKSILTCLMSLCAFFFLRAQETIIGNIDQDKLDKLIQLAKEHVPDRKIAGLTTEKAKSAQNSQLATYLDLVSVSYFYRPDNQTALGVENPYIVNGFQFGVNLNLGTLLQKPAEVKIAKADYKIAQLQQIAFDEQLEMEVRRRYYGYLLSLNDLKIKTQTFQDVKALSDDRQLRFESGEVELAAYAEGKTALSEAGSARLESEAAYLEAKDMLEQLIGTKIEMVE